MLDQINATPWSKYAQPEWNKPSSVVDALAEVARGEKSAYNSLLYAVGNNHGGTYYPVLLAAMPFLEAIIHDGEAPAQRVALCVLDDLFASFHPEPGHEEVDLPDGSRRRVEIAFKERMHALRPDLQRIYSEGGPNAALAGEIMQLLGEDAV